jgi:hypothetical protein
MHVDILIAKKILMRTNINAYNYCCHHTHNTYYTNTLDGNHIQIAPLFGIKVPLDQITLHNYLGSPPWMNPSIPR